MLLSKSLHATLMRQWLFLIIFAVHANSDLASFTNSAARASSSMLQNTMASMPLFSKDPNQPNSLSKTIQELNPSSLRPECVPYTEIPFPPPKSSTKSEVQPRDASFSNPQTQSRGSVTATSPPILNRRLDGRNFSSPIQTASGLWEGPEYISNPYLWQYPGNGPERTSEELQCRTVWESSYTSWLQSQSAMVTMSSANITRNDVPRNAEIALDQRSYWPLPYVNSQHNTFTFTPSSSCCLECWIKDWDVEVYYWPAPTLVPPVTKLTNSKGYILTSPSVYVKFQSLYATDFCGTMFLQKDVITIPFDPDELSTTAGYKWNTADFSVGPILGNGIARFTRATWSDQKNMCSDTASSFWQIHYSSERYSDVAQLTSAWSSYYSSLGCGVTDINDRNYDHYTITYNPCSPVISVPTKIFSLNSVWAHCSGQLYDPPSALTPGSDFSTAAHSMVNPPDRSPGGGAPGAAPGVAPAPGTASATAEVEHKPTNTNTAASGSAIGGNNPAPSSNGDSSSNGSPAPNGGSSPNEISSPKGAPGFSPEIQDPANNLGSHNGPQPDHPAPAKGGVPVNPINGLPPPTNPHPADDSQASPSIDPINGLRPPTNAQPADNSQASAPVNPINGFLLPSNPRPGDNPPPPPVNGVQASNTPALVTNSPSSDTIPKYILGHGSYTLAPGSIATISGTVISLQPGGLSIVFDGKTIALDSYLSTAGLNSGASVIVGGKTEKFDGTNPKTSSYGKTSGSFNGTILVENGSGVLMGKGIWVSGVIVVGIVVAVLLL